MSDTVDETYSEPPERTGPVHQPSALGADGRSGTPVEDVLTVQPAAEITLAVGDDGWAVERSAADVSALNVGDTVQFTRPMEPTDIAAFAQVSGDTNPLHLDGDFAAETRFDGRIVHGTLVAGTISAALARFPGVTIYLSQDLEFLAPVEVGGTVTATCEIVRTSATGAPACTRASPATARP